LENITSFPNNAAASAARVDMTVKIFKSTVWKPNLTPVQLRIHM